MAARSRAATGAQNLQPKGPAQALFHVIRSMGFEAIRIRICTASLTDPLMDYTDGKVV